MEHVSGSITVVKLVAIVHHACPSLTNAASTESSKTEEEHEERTNDEDRGLDGGKGHHTLHTAEHSEYGGEDDKTYRACPEVQAPEILKEDTACKGCNTHLSEDICNKCDDRKPRAGALCVAELEEVWHGDDFAHLVDEKLIERYEKPTEDEDHPSLHLPVCHTNTTLGSSTCKTYEVLATDVSGKDSHTDYIPRLALTKEVG